MIAVVGNGIAGSRRLRRPEGSIPRRVVPDERALSAIQCLRTGDYVAIASGATGFLRTAEDFGKAGIELLLSSQVMDWSAEEQLLHLDDGTSVMIDWLSLREAALRSDLPGFGKQGVVALKNLRMQRCSGGSGSAVVVGTGPVGIRRPSLRRRGWTVPLSSC